jgi:hypothetical protein
MPNDLEDVCLSGKTGSERRAVKVTRLTQSGLYEAPAPSRATLNFDCWKQGDFFAINHQQKAENV